MYVFQCERHGLEYSGALDFWDVNFYSNLVEETVYAVDEEEVSVLSAVFMGRLLGCGSGFESAQNFNKKSRDPRTVGYGALSFNILLTYHSLSLSFINHHLLISVNNVNNSI